MTTETNSQGEINRDHQLALAAQRKEVQRLHELAAVRGELHDDEDVIDLREYWSILLRRKWTVVATFLISFVVALVATFNTTPIYRSTLLLNIERQSDQVLEYQSVSPAENTYSNWEFYKTQYELLRSRSLARQVIDQLGLVALDPSSEEDGQSFFAELIDTFGGLTSGDFQKEDAEDFRSAPSDPEAVLLENLEVAPVKDSRLVRIHYHSADPREAAAVANAIADSYVNSTLERRYDSNSYAKKFLDERIAQVRANLEDSERRLVAYAREREIVNLDDKLGNLMQTLREMNSELVSAEAERIQAEAKYEEYLEEGGKAMGNVLNSPVIQSLKERRVALESEYQEQLKIYKPGYPKMQQLQRQIAEVNGEIAEEVASIGKSYKIDYDGDVRRQANLQARIADVKSEILALQDRSTDYQTLKREVDTNRELYDGLLQRMKEVGVVAGIGTNNISIIDRAEVPIRPFKPSLTKNLAIAMAFGLFGGVMLAFVFEMLDDTVKTSEDVEKRVGAPVLGIVPLAVPRDGEPEKEALGLLAFKDPKSPMAEAVRSLRASLIFATSEGAPKVMHFTSSGPGEGKTTTATSTAITFAQSGRKVLLIDADLRDPSLHRTFSLPNVQGLTNYLAGDATPAEIARPTQMTGLFTVTSGPLPPNPVELLSSAKMLDLLNLAAERFDFVILDGPPVIGLADALVIANLANATIFVVETGVTRSGALDASIKRLRAANALIVGSVLAKFRRAGMGYGYGYDYLYSYSYGRGSDSAALPKQS
jgi:capsular exopolysaccharide synthesis family protein